MFIGRKAELEELQKRYEQEAFQLFILYGRRRVGKTTLLNEFCRDKDTIFYSAEQSNDKLNLEKFSRQVFAYYGETALEPFAGWEKALTYIDSRQKGKRLILVFDEFPYLAQKNKALLSVQYLGEDNNLYEWNSYDNSVVLGSYDMKRIVCPVAWSTISKIMSAVDRYNCLPPFSATRIFPSSFAISPSDSESG